MFTKSGARGDTMSLVEAWQALGGRYGLDVTSANSQAIVASGVVRGRSLRVDIHRNRKPTEPFHGLAEKRRRMKMRHHWSTEVTVSCSNPLGLQGALQSFIDIRDPSWKPLDVDPSRWRIVRTEPVSLAPHVLDASIHARLLGMNGDHQIFIEPTRIRLTVEDTSEQIENGYFTGSPLHVEYPGPWPATFRERALVGPPWWFDLLCDIADAVDAPAPRGHAASSMFGPAGSSWARAGGPFAPDAPSSDGRGKLVTFALLAGVLVIAGAVAFALTRPSADDEAGATDDPIETAGPAPTTGASVGTTTPQAPDDPTAVQVGQLFTGTAIATLIDEIAVANGTEPMQLVSVLVYPEYLTAQGQGPGAEQTLVEYRWVGQLTPATPAPVVPDDVAARLFSSDEVAWSAIPALVEAAPAAVSIEGGIVTHLNVERSLPFSDDIRVRVFVSGPGGDGYVDGDAAGSMISINGN
jgi:hypothetical protein